MGTSCSSGRSGPTAAQQPRGRAAEWGGGRRGRADASTEGSRAARCAGSSCWGQHTVSLTRAGPRKASAGRSSTPGPRGAGHRVPQPDGRDPDQRGDSRRWAPRAAEDSLRRPGTDRIDLVQVDRPSPDTDIEEPPGALTGPVRQDRVRYLGSSPFPGGQIAEARCAPAGAWSDSSASRRRTPRWCAVSRPTSCHRGPIRLDVITYGPPGDGRLSGPRHQDAGLPTPACPPLPRSDSD
ncbi:aldo/keto reductase [Streptomyces sp. NPDC017259]|uniref:aldo/keto reductase n=1 Tax=Streptomyces sp. NPDC017259 TaxID=3364991 RepID=UPI003797E189